MRRIVRLRSFKFAERENLRAPRCGLARKTIDQFRYIKIHTKEIILRLSDE